MAEEGKITKEEEKRLLHNNRHQVVLMETSKSHSINLLVVAGFSPLLTTMSN